jgi:DNA-binding transcriptional LysR family regulator
LKLRDDAMRKVGELHNLKAGHLALGARESAAVYLLPGPLGTYFHQLPRIKVGIDGGRLEEIPRRVMDREIDVGIVKDEPAFHGLRSARVHAAEMILIASPDHPLTSHERVQVKDRSDM